MGHGLSFWEWLFKITLLFQSNDDINVCWENGKAQQIYFLSFTHFRLANIYLKTGRP